MDLVRLRQILGPFIEALKDLETHERLGSLCDRLGLPNPDVVGSKRDRMRASFAALADDDLPIHGTFPIAIERLSEIWSIAKAETEHSLRENLHCLVS